MTCEICNKGEDDVVLFRVNEFGIKGIWRCKEHLTPKQKSDIDYIVANIVSIIEEDNAK